MNLNSEFMYLLHSIGRCFLQNVAAMVPFYITMSTMCKRKKPLWPIVLLMSMKFLVLTALWYTLLTHYFGELSWWSVVGYLVTLFFVIWNFCILIYGFEGNYVKIGLASILCELIAVPFSYTGLMVANLLEGHENLLSLMGWMSPADLLMPLISTILYLICYHFLKGVFLKFREYQIRHKKLLVGVITGYIFLGAVSGLQTVQTDLDTSVKMSFLPMIILAIGSLLVILWYLAVWRRNIWLEHAYLVQMRKVMETQYFLINRQMKQMEKNQKQMEENMQKIYEMKSSSLKSERIHEYLTFLEMEYESIKVGIYTGVWDLDVILCREAEVCRQHQIPTDILVQEFQGVKSAPNRFRATWDLLELAIEENKKMPVEERFLKFHMATVKGQIVYELDCASPVRRLLLARYWKRRAKLADGYLVYHFKERKMQIVAAIQISESEKQVCDGGTMQKS